MLITFAGVCYRKLQLASPVHQAQEFDAAEWREEELKCHGIVVRDE